MKIDIESHKTAAFVRKELLFVTGTRADYGKLEPLALAAVKAGFKVTMFVTGMHLMEKYGLTKTEIHKREEFGVVEFLNQREGDPLDVILAKTISGFSDYVQENCPDLVVIHGDRIEALACALVCATNYIRCAHVEGGEISGTIDETFRHCTTKLSSLHLVSSQDAKERVMRLGESKDTAYVIGSPELDIHSKPSGVTIEDVRARYDIKFSEYGICVFHPVTSELNWMAEQAQNLFSTIVESRHKFVIILPNNDPGSDKIIAEIEKLPHSHFRILPSMRFKYFSELMKNAQVILGNSSMGVREAPFLGIPSLDIGTRQSNRAVAESLQHCAANDRETILEFLKNNWGRRFSVNKAFGTGGASQRFISLLQNEQIWSVSLQKKFVD